MPTFPPDLVPGAPVSAAWMRRMLAACRACTPISGKGVRISYKPNGAFINVDVDAVGSVAEAKYFPFLVRFHTTDTDTTGQWEIRIPNGSVSVGGACSPINRRASDTSGHDGEDGWYLLYLDESEGTAETRQETDADGNTITVSTRRWAVTAHCKTSAKITGVDALNAAERRLVYFSADKIAAPGETFTDEQMARTFAWGDEFSAVVGTIVVEERNGEKTKRFEKNGMMAIAVAGRAKQNFDLVWYFSVAKNGKISCDNVYAIRNNMTVAGMTVVGETMTDVSALYAAGNHKLYANIRINGAGQNVIAVYVDPSDTNPDSDFTVWAQLYSKGASDLVDYRASALNNIQVYR